MNIVLFPRSLSGRLVLLLLAGLIMAQVITARLLFVEQGETIQRTAGFHSAQRIAGVVRLLDDMTEAEREHIVQALDGPGMRLKIGLAPIPEEEAAGLLPSAVMFLQALRFHLDSGYEVRMRSLHDDVEERFEHPGQGPFPRSMGMYPMMRRHMGGGGRLLPGPSFLVQVRLADGNWVSFGERLSMEEGAWPLRLLVTLVLVLITLVLVTLLAVRWITRPLAQLAEGAHHLGQDLARPPLAEKGSLEVRRTIHAFNAMQERIRHFVEERSRFLAAVSHDLKTPITRMRLRTELMEDEGLKGKFTQDLTDMETLVQGTLDYMRGVTPDEAMQRMDLMALLESIQADAEEIGQLVTLSGNVVHPINGRPLALRRAITNLVENGVKYGGRVKIGVEGHAGRLLVRVTDDGPGIPEDQREAVFEPFRRLEDSRGRETGGSGLGLGIARHIVRTHGGELTLSNGPEGGLVAELSLPC